MESRTKDLTNDAKDMGRNIKDAATETAEDWAERTKTAGLAAMNSAKAAYQAAQSKTVAGAKATDQAIRANPYTALGIALSAGIVIGLLIKRK
ncbi:MAG: DUF883 domain-containing protein [Verrucomicrobiota bacterium]